MLTQEEANRLISLIKSLDSHKPIHLPDQGGMLQLNASSPENEKFIIDVKRGRINISQATLQTRYNKSLPLIRLDIEGPAHTNPDLEIIECPHIHIYREGYLTRWAYPVEKVNKFTNMNDLTLVLYEFLKFSNVYPIPDIGPSKLF